jgi:type II secretory pathway component PulF
MGKIADLYLSQAQRHARVLLDVLSPLILLLMGGLVLGGSTYLLMVYTKLSEIMML